GEFLPAMAGTTTDRVTLSPPVVEIAEPGSIPQHAGTREPAESMCQDLGAAIEPKLAAGTDVRMLIQDHDLQRVSPGPPFQLAADLVSLRGVCLGPEAADFVERIGPAEDERARRPLQEPRDRVPDCNEEFPAPGRLVEAHPAAAARVASPPD